MSDVLTLPILSLPDVVVLPGMVVPVALDADTRAVVDAARAGSDGELLLAPRLADRYPTYGVIATVEQIGRLPGGEQAAVLRAGRRARLGSGVPGPGAALWVEAEPVADEPVTEQLRGLADEYRTVVIAILQRRNAWQVVDSVQRITDPSELADLAGYAPYLTDEQKRELLETPDVEARLLRVLAWARDHLAELEVSEKIQTDVREGMDKRQREFLLREQLAAIRKELGEGEPEGSDDYRARVEAADLPEKVREAALREVDKLERASDQSPETGWIRTWLDTVLGLPWGEKTDDNTDIAGAREILDADHHGLDDVKDRIVEYLAVRSRRAERGMEVVGGRGSGAVLALVGPPGVGKTSLGESVARALGRKFVRVALGGVRDEAEIRGHRRTYVGALPGRIVRAIGEAGSMNPVVLLDEIDKVGSDFRGDPAAALLEVLDPAQNHTFRDHYLEVDLDLSDVVFLATANVADTIPEALYDRMEVVTLDGYTEDDKVSIARTHLVPRQLSRAALNTDEVSISDEALRRIAGEYTREAGVRQLERAVARVLRKVATKLAADDTPIHVEESNLRDFLGRPRFLPESAERTAVPGVATGLAVTGTGGDVLFIEATAMPGEARLHLTGQLGDVMKESAHIALSYLRSHRPDLVEALDRTIHLHVPAGAVPKDGPSAGVTMVTALASLATGVPVRSDVGMTGEVTLNGRVLPIGGVKQKLLAAQRAGLTTVFIPQRNEPDLDDVPAEVLAALDVRPVGDVAEILAHALERQDAVTQAA
ncbi:ATP-dependent Lon protease [Jatrophihabitans endophyticus]|uniref:Lon protease n=1 Tax=Jatrophihabitans endophyticus TaxID=1206085 RepID=A0A1M5SRF0_9ACTN|nr:endopeptidase La [Jatrophihabitans endophyticus]SHH40898.1 ATP-dependent Lon protease [Jatrophihabitans endophyticus]